MMLLNIDFEIDNPGPGSSYMELKEDTIRDDCMTGYIHIYSENIHYPGV